jgi:tetratricopeptide (TPR) repeat protein
LDEAALVLEPTFKLESPKYEGVRRIVSTRLKIGTAMGRLPIWASTRVVTLALVAVATVQSAPQTPQDDAVAGALQVRTALARDDVAQAQENVAAALKTYPGSPLILAAAGDVAFRRADFEGSETSYKNALRAQPRLAQGWLGLGRLAEIMSMRKSAREYYQRAYDLDGDDPEILVALAGSSTNRTEVNLLLEQFLRLTGSLSPWRTSAVRARIERNRSLGDRKTNRLTSPYQRARIPIQASKVDDMGGQRLTVKVVFNGNRTERLLLDSGAEGLLLSKDAATRVGVEPLSGETLVGIGDRESLSGRTSLVQSLQVGPVEFRDVVVSVADVWMDSDIAGLIGLETFSAFVTTIDTPRSELRLEPHQSPPALLADRTPPSEGSLNFPLVMAGRLPCIWARVNKSGPALFLLDTGSNTNVIGESLARQTSIVMTAIDRSVSGVAGGVHKVGAADRALIRFAQFEQTNQSVTVLDLTPQSRSFGFEVSGILGMPILRLVSMTIDYQNGVAHFERSK